MSMVLGTPPSRRTGGRGAPGTPSEEEAATYHTPGEGADGDAGEGTGSDDGDGGDGGIASPERCQECDVVVPPVGWFNRWFLKYMQSEDIREQWPRLDVCM